jgi:hypothetical protein
MNYIGIHNTDMWETKQMFPTTHIQRERNYNKPSELQQGYFPKLTQTQDLQPSPVVMLTRRAQEFHHQNVKMNGKATETLAQTNKRKCTGIQPTHKTDKYEQQEWVKEWNEAIINPNGRNTVDSQRTNIRDTANKIVTQPYTEKATTTNKEMPTVTKNQQGKYTYTKNTHTKREITNKHQMTNGIVIDDNSPEMDIQQKQ